MAWFDEAVFYHIYPLGLTGAPKQNSYGEPEHRLRDLYPWIDHIKEIGCNGVYIGPLFESVGHGYETTDYKKLDSRLGDNNDLKEFVSLCHKKGIKVILDGVFNHVGRDFFAFKDLKEYREGSRYRDWFCNVNFWNNNEYNDGFSYDNWGGYNLLVKLNQRNPEVKDYIAEVIRFWVSEFDIDGLRLDAADVLDFDFMHMLRWIANEVKPDFYLMGEVIHGEYSRWVNDGTLHAVTNYHLHKALYSGHNDHNYFEIAHTVKRLNDMGGQNPNGLRLYNFVDNHDVERIYTKLNNKAHFAPAHILMYTLPGIPSIYYGSEFAIEGRKERYSDDSLRPYLRLEDFKDEIKRNPNTVLIAKLGVARQNSKALSYGKYQELLLTNRQYAFRRQVEGEDVVVTVNNDDGAAFISVSAGGYGTYYGVLSGKTVHTENGGIHVELPANSGEIWVSDINVIKSLNEVKPEEPEEESPFVDEDVPEIKVPNAVITGIHHIAIKCIDEQQFEKAVDFYENILGLPCLRSWGQGKEAGAMFKVGASVMELFASGGNENVLGAIPHFALATPHVDDCAAAVKAAGYQVFMEPTDICIPATPALEARIAFCYGPVGEEIEFFCQKSGFDGFDTIL